MTIYLATAGSRYDRNFEATEERNLPALLVAYPYRKPFLDVRDRISFRHWVLDSGAYSAWNQGIEICNSDFIAEAKRLRETDPKLSEIFALDVIGDAKASIDNAIEMTEAGIDCIPTYHIGEPENHLMHLSRNYRKIALGGVAKMRGEEKLTWAKQCFARVWPKRIHGFGFGQESHVMALPWDSVDATNWEVGPCAFGMWTTYGRLSVRGGSQILVVEIRNYLSTERRATARWKKTMNELEKHERENPI